MNIIDYKKAGVDVEAGNDAVQKIKSIVTRSFTPQVLTGIGHFASMYDLKSIFTDYEHPILVQSIDGVGTKMMVAKKMQRFDTIGIDLVSATTNDIVVLGAKPLTLLDYIANERLDPEIIAAIVTGITAACCDNNIALVGGETAEMPGTYSPGELDLVGIVTGIVEKDKAILGTNICPGDIVAAFPSNGLHTNGYSLARKLFFDIAQYNVDSYIPGLEKTIGEALLEPHINYCKPVHYLLENDIHIKGMAHITGGGILENIPRILPPNCQIEINKNTIPEPAIFSLLRRLGHLDDKEMYRTFNMGVGLILILTADMYEQASYLAANSGFPLLHIGQVITGATGVKLL